VFMLGGCETLDSLLQYEKPTATLNGVSFGDVSLEAAEVLFDVQIRNPYALDLPLLNVDYDLQSDGHALLNGKADAATVIPAKSAQAVTLPVTFNYRDLLGALAFLKDVRPGSQIPYTAAVGLSVDTPVAGPLRLPLSKDGTLTIPTLQDAAGADWQELLQSGRNLLNAPK